GAEDRLYRVRVSLHAPRSEGHGRGRGRRNSRGVRRAAGCAWLTRQGDRHGQLQPVSPGVVAPAGSASVSRRHRGGVAMKVEGERDFSAPRTTVWEVLNDPSRLAKTMPGVQSFDVQDDRHWRANLKIPLGPGGLKMTVDFEKTGERELEFAQLYAKG